MRPPQPASNAEDTGARRFSGGSQMFRQLVGMFAVLGWGDIGAVKQMSVGFEVHNPKDLQGKGCFFIQGDPIQPKIYSTIGGITPKQVMVTEILSGLSNGSINVLSVPPLAAEQL